MAYSFWLTAIKKLEVDAERHYGVIHLDTA